MLVQTSITEKREITKEIKLPYTSKKGNCYYRINEDGSILKVYVNKTWVNIDFTLADGFGYKSLTSDVMEGEECPEDEVLNAVEFSTDLVAKSVIAKNTLTKV